MLLVGIGGSGRQSLAKLASYTLEYKVFMIEVTKHYRRQEFHEGIIASPVLNNVSRFFFDKIEFSCDKEKILIFNV